MQLGMPTMIELPDLEANAKVCRDLALQFVEINMNLPMFQPEKLGAARTLSERYGVGFTIHLDENFAPADFNPLVVESYRETMRRTLRAAKEMEAPVVNMHLGRGVHFKLPDRVIYLYDRYREEYLEQIRRLRELCEEEIGDCDLRVCIENTDGYLDHQKAAIELLLDSPVFALTWDIGHSHTASVEDAPFLLAHRNRLAHFHVHDALGKRCHLILGEGEIDLTRYIELADSLNARCVLETKTVEALERSSTRTEGRSRQDSHTHGPNSTRTGLRTPHGRQRPRSR